MEWTLEMVSREARNRHLSAVQRWMTAPLDELRVAARAARRGPVHIRCFAPLYPNNHCKDICGNCRMAEDSGITRKAMTDGQVLAAAHELKAAGYDAAASVTGSWDPDPVDRRGSMTATNRRVLEAIRSVGLQPMMNAGPFEQRHLEVLFDAAGPNGVHSFYQETFHRPTYQTVYGESPFKGDPDARLQQHVRATQAGWQHLAVAALLGQAPDVSMEIACVLTYRELLLSETAAASVIISAPRIVPFEGIRFPGRVDDEVFERAVLIYRMLAPRADILLTARETPEMRDRLIDITDVLGVQGRTEPLEPGQSYLPRPGSLPVVNRDGQFYLFDRRSIQEVRAAIGAS